MKSIARFQSGRRRFLAAFILALIVIGNDAESQTLSVSETTIGAVGTITATWSGIPTPTTTDWIGLFAPNTADTEFIDWIYVSCSKTPDIPRASGSCPFVVPTTLAAGPYELRLFPNDGFTPRLATSNPFAVVTLSVTETTIATGGTIIATWDGIPTPTTTDWIGLYTPGAANTAFLAWRYTTGTASGSVPFVIPGLPPGTYELRLFSNDVFTLLSTSNTLTVTVSGPPDVIGEWGSVMDWPIVAIHAHLLPTGIVIFWDNEAVNGIHLWDPGTETISGPAQPDYNIFCSGHAFLPNGSLLVTGGQQGLQDYDGLERVTIYDPVINSWSPLPNMTGNRWYPTNTTLSNGDVLVTGGSTMINIHNDLPQIWQTESRSWRNLTGAQDQIPLGVLPNNNNNQGSLYPRMFLAPDGRVFKAGPDGETWYLDTSGLGLWIEGPSSSFGFRNFGSAVMYEPGKVLIVGGGDPPTATAEVIDLNATTPAWRTVLSMGSSRRQHNATVLPDGTVLVMGGSSGSGFNNDASPVYAAELWDPNTEEWSTMASMRVARLYHSTALLLPDGRILSAGGWGRNELNAQLYSPPYLFNSDGSLAPRPVITPSEAPTTVFYGQGFFIPTPDPTSITRVSLIRLSSVTHSFDANQRFNGLNFTPVSGGLNATAPATANLAPPGHYMLFILNADGVPSVARIIQLS